MKISITESIDLFETQYPVSFAVTLRWHRASRTLSRHPTHSATSSLDTCSVEPFLLAEIQRLANVHARPHECNHSCGVWKPSRRNEGVGAKADRATWRPCLPCLIKAYTPLAIHSKSFQDTLLTWRRAFVLDRRPHIDEDVSLSPGRSPRLVWT